MSGNNISPQSIPSPIQPSQQQAGTSALFPTPAQAVSRLQSQEAPTQSMRMQPEESVPPKEAQDLQPDEVLDSYPEEPIPPKEAQDLQPDEVPDSYPEEPIPPFQAKPNVSGTQPQASPPGQSPPYRLTSSLDYFQPNGFARDIAAYQAYANCKTGYVSLDNTQPRYPGLYLLGAISSLGKTTNAHQMGDQIAASGESVLYFSLEQNRFELYICEGAIDAISLYLVRAGTKINHAEQGLYCAIGGVANQQRIDRIKNYAADAGCQVVIAVDNDKAGEQCRQRNPDCRAWIPRLKDWNEGLLQQEKDFQKLECGFSLVDLLNDAVKRHRKRS